METTPKVHRHRHHRSDSHHRRYDRQVQQTNNSSEQTHEKKSPIHEHAVERQDILSAEEGCSTTSEIVTTIEATNIHLTQENERHNLSEDIETLTTTQSQTSQQTVVLVNGHIPPVDEQDVQDTLSASDETTVQDKNDDCTTLPAPHLESPTLQQAAGSSRNSSGDALSLRETLQQLPASVTSHRHRRSTHSPQTNEGDSSFHRGILGFMDRELKQCSPTPSALSSGGGTTRKLQSLSDPQASPAQRSIRSRSSIEKSPRRKRSKSESRRRRERKLIAAGEMEVRQANETLMRYLKQCSEMNDASLSGELEIDQNYDERRVHRKTKSQRDKRGHLLSKLYTAGGLSSILKELSDDIVPAEGEEIYNPFTPVVSPTDDTPAHIDKMFLQTSSGYRPVEHCYYKYSFTGAHGSGGDGGGGRRAGVSLNGPTGNCSVEGRIGRDMGRGGSTAGVLMHGGGGNYVDTRFLLDVARYGSQKISTNIQLACVVQRIWFLISNICHGLLAGLALAHLLFVLSSYPMEWSTIISGIGLAGEASNSGSPSTMVPAVEPTIDSGNISPSPSLTSSQHLAIIGNYAVFAEMYLNTFYCLAIMCLVSIFDRMDICHWQLSNATETVSFRWLIIIMIYVATIILTICSNSIDENLFYYNNANVTLTQEEMLSKSVLSVWSSLSVTRSIGAICGWFMIGLAPHEDMLYEHLVDLTRH